MQRIGGGLCHENVLFVDRTNGGLTNRYGALMQFKRQGFQATHRVGLDDHPASLLFCSSARLLLTMLGEFTASHDFAAC